MKFQWTFLLGLIFALIVAIFAVINVDPVTVNYLFGTSQWPLILVIIGSVLMGGTIIGSVGLMRLYVIQRKVKALEKENALLRSEMNQLQVKDKTPENKEPLKKTAPDGMGE
ncbi:putative integral membrane protein [Bacillus pakistanensis]|uniref:Integral membrane protein n=1 Tax=Rossellomorea pakistanensis TaxID=992288 RepID=A0ABS2NAC1_9BACI|nr:lipopolysaccharide assembly protein LapA domain-containing protein [Bacillus pakistanensis]MBM7584807.1 putative integral membrane protein [Bacillus pakistanensis]